MNKVAWTIIVGLLSALLLGLCIPVSRFESPIGGLPFVMTSEGFLDITVRDDGLHLINYPRFGEFELVADRVIDPSGHETWRSNRNSDVYTLRFFLWGAVLEVSDEHNPTVTRRAWGFRSFRGESP